MRIALLDVQYKDTSGYAACIIADDWKAPAPNSTLVIQCPDCGEYEPGSFYKRELGPLLAVLAQTTEHYDVVVIDSYVWLDSNGAPGLGARLFDRLGGTPVVGIAKSSFKDASFAEKVLRGQSQRPLFVTSAGMNADEAAGYVQKMHGSGRLPELVKLVDRIARAAANHP
jgi:deoxyribonuclease V